MQTMTRSQQLLALALLALACSSGCAPGAEPDPRSSSHAATTFTVAAVQYDSGQASLVKPACTSDAAPDVCAVVELMSQAKAKGAMLVVAPETILGQKYYETDPTLGENPGQSAQWPATSFIKTFSLRAKQQQLYIVIHLATQTASDAYSTQVAFGPDGSVVGKHHKFELYSSEAKTYTPGTDVMVFDSPLGKVGLLICADIYGDLALHSKLADTLKARVLAFSTAWTVPGSANWQAAFARNWGLYVVGANWSATAVAGGGIFDPTGKALDQQTLGTPGLAVAQIPAV
jgi:predicted amidohydrolase